MQTSIVESKEGDTNDSPEDSDGLEFLLLQHTRYEIPSNRCKTQFSCFGIQKFDFMKR